MAQIDADSGVADAGAAGPGIGRNRPALAALADVSVSVLAIGVLALIGVIKEVLPLGSIFTSGGDVAFIELQIRQAIHGGTALGPYSRYGWHHPGPAIFYLFAPIYWLSREASRSLFLNSWLLNVGCALLTVVVIRRFSGEPAARVTAALILVYLAASGFIQAINPWNPSLLALPLLLVLALTAGAVRGSLWALVGVVAAASVTVQTHIATAPLCGACVVTAIGGTVGYLLGHRNGPPIEWRKPLAGALVLIGLLWGPPLAQEISARHGNLSLLIDFYHHPPASAGVAGHSLASALRAVSDYVTVVPFGNPTDLLGHGARLVGAAAIALIGIASGIGWWRRDRFMAWLGLLTPIGLAVATLASMRIVGPYMGYLFFWTQTLALPALLSGVAGVMAMVPLRPSIITSAGAVPTLAALAVAMSVVVRGDPVSFPDSPDARAAATAIENAVARNRAIPVTLDVFYQDYADGPLILTLVKNGYRVRVAPEMDLYLGDTTALDPKATFDVGGAASPAPESSDRELVKVGMLSIWQRGPG